MDRPRSRQSALLLLILFTASCLYAVSFKNDFIWDDHHLVGTENIHYTPPTVPAMFTTHLYHGVGESNFYRPMQSLSFLLDYAIWRLNPLGYHLTNLILHLINVVLAYLLIKNILKNKEAGLLTALIFAVHPINTEAVTYIAGRADPLSVAFLLGALILYIRAVGAGGLRYMGLLSLSVFLFLCGLLTKEASLVFPLILVIYDYFIRGEQTISPKALGRYAPYFIATLAYIILRLFILGLPHRLVPHPPAGAYLLTTPKILVTYIALLFFPVHLHMERLVQPIWSVFNREAVFYIALLICLLWACKVIYSRSKVLFFFIVFFFITLLPMMNILTINAPMAEHWLYLPSLGIYAVISYALIKIINLKNAAAKFTAAALTVFLAFFCIRTVFRNIEWGRPFEFYRNLLRYTPHSARGHTNIAVFYASEKNFALAKQEFKASLEISPGDQCVYYWLGWLAINEGNKKEAVEYWKKSLDSAPLYKPAQEIMARYLYKENREFRRLLKAVSENPKDARANYRLSKIYINHGLYLKAFYRIEKTLEIDPGFKNALFNRAWLYSRLALYDKAIKEYENLMKLTPKDPDLYENLSYCYEAINRPKEAKAMRAKATSLKKSKNF